MNRSFWIRKRPQPTYPRRVRVLHIAAASAFMLLQVSCVANSSSIGPDANATFATVDNQSWSLGDHRGEWVVVAFQSNWCTPCRQEVKELLSLRSQKPEIAVVTIGFSESVEDTRRFVQSTGVTWPAVADPLAEISKKWNVYSLPTTVLMDPNGVEAKRFLGKLTAENVTAAIGRSE